MVMFEIFRYAQNDKRLILLCCKSACNTAIFLNFSKTRQNFIRFAL